LRFDILSLIPEYFRGPFDASILKRGRQQKILEINLLNIRDFAQDRHKRVDDRPFGGGPGMVLMPEPVTKAIRSVKTAQSKVVYLTPQGAPLTAKKCRRLASDLHLIIVCGHYEGIDERVIEAEVDEEISIGDFVLTNGCAAAVVLVDAVSRFVPGVLGNENAVEEDSFENGGILDCPHYTRPNTFEGKDVPQVLLSGNHKKIQEWRQSRAFDKTRRMRPDLLER